MAGNNFWKHRPRCVNLPKKGRQKDWWKNYRICITYCYCFEFVLKHFLKFLLNLIHFKFLVPRRPKNHWKSLWGTKTGGVFYNNDLTKLITEIILGCLNNLPLTFTVTTERATVPGLLRASQEYSPLSFSATPVIRSWCNRVSIIALSIIESPSFFHITFIVSSLTLQVNVRMSPFVSVMYFSGTTRAEAFPALKRGNSLEC